LEVVMTPKYQLTILSLLWVGHSLPGCSRSTAVEEDPEPRDTASSLVVDVGTDPFSDLFADIDTDIFVDMGSDADGDRDSDTEAVSDTEEGSAVVTVTTDADTDTAQAVTDTIGTLADTIIDTGSVVDEDEGDDSEVPSEADRSTASGTDTTAGTDSIADTTTDTDAPMDTDARPDITWTEQPIDGDFESPHAVHAADVDGDGDMDVLGAAIGANTISWWENLDGTGSGWLGHAVDSAFEGAISVHAADMDGDGDMDVLGTAYYGDTISWWENTDGVGLDWLGHMLSDTFDGAEAVHAADLDGDGDMDVLGAAIVAGQVHWWENADGFGDDWIEHIVSDDFAGAISVHGVDLDGDGDVDILGAADSDDLMWWENVLGDGTAFEPHIVQADFPKGQAVKGDDVDGDGDVDILAASRNNTEIAWWMNTEGDGSQWTKQVVDSTFGSVRFVCAADLDADGLPDVIGTANGTASTIAWWQNPGEDDTGWLKWTVAESFGGAVNADAADVNGDGRLDILAAGFQVDAITWWESTGPDVPVILDRRLEKQGPLPTTARVGPLPVAVHLPEERRSGR
jgi:hypothetical protein